MSAGGSNKAIVAALSANLGIAVTKLIAWAVTGASSMLAESIHSLADSGNQVLLLVGGRRARREATPEHPFGFGRARYVYAFIVSIVLFTLGGLFALYEAYHKWHSVHAGHPDALLSSKWWWLPLVVLLLAMVMEGLSFRTAVREANTVRGTSNWATYIRRAKAPEIPVVLLEDAGALLGLAFAFVGVAMTKLTGSGYWDVAGTAAIGILLVVIAVILAIETSSLLLGESAGIEEVRRIETALGQEPLVQRLIHMRTMHLGPEELLVAAKIGVGTNASAEEVADAIDAAERRIRQAVPIATTIYIEPDIWRADYVPDAHPEVPHAPGGH